MSIALIVIHVVFWNKDMLCHSEFDATVSFGKECEVLSLPEELTINNIKYKYKI